MIDRRRWGIAIGQMLQARIAAGEVAPRVRPMPAPGPHASDEDIARAEHRLGFELDPQHAALLREIDGWDDVFGNGDLLATADLGAGPRWSAAQQLLDVMYEDGPFESFPPRDAVYPFHASELDVFVIWRGGPATDQGCPVYWLHGEVVDTWSNVFGYCLAAITLNQISIDEVRDPAAERTARRPAARIQDGRVVRGTWDGRPE